MVKNIKTKSDILKKTQVEVEITKKKQLKIILENMIKLVIESDDKDTSILLYKDKNDKDAIEGTIFFDKQALKDFAKKW